MCLVEYKQWFGIAENSEVPSFEFASRTMECVGLMFEHDVSGILNGLSSFVAFA